ncbi:MAG: FAD binding domain-containing protein, partial [Candidatus Thorarchaeota archaeon]
GNYGKRAKVIAGGTDLLTAMKDEIHPIYPEVLVDIKTTPRMYYIQEEAGALNIGALTTLSTIAKSFLVKDKYAALAQAAYAVGSPQRRNMGTIGGNLCQEVRCWYYRAPSNYFYCLRKGGMVCPAVPGDNRYNAILGATICFAVCPSDIAIALGALNAAIVTNKRSIPILDFFFELGNVLGNDEIVTEIQVPEPQSGTKQAFLKFRIRKTIDFAISSVATAITVEAGTVVDARIILGAVAPMPYRATDAEDALKGKAISESVAEGAGVAAVKDAKPISKNAYLIPITKALVKRAILA